jgi:transposase-like protein
MNALAWLRKHLDGEGGNDVIREMVKVFAEELMSAEADNACGASWGERSPERVNSRNGYRSRDFDTRAGSISLAIPKLRSGSYFPDWLLEPRRRAEKALVAVVAEAYVAGVSTRRVDGLVQSMGIDGISKSQVSEMARSLDAQVEAFRSRPLDAGPYTYLAVDALTQRVREGGRIVNVACAVATGVNADGHREVLGIDVFTTETGAGWTAFLRALVARGLAGVSLVVSDAHQGLVEAIAAVLAGAGWQRCKVHLMRNILGTVTAASKDMVAATVRTIFAQPSAEACRAQLHEVERILKGQFPKAAAILEGAEADVLAHTAFPRGHWRKIASTNPLERINKEIKRRSNVVGIFPDDASVIRLVGAVLLDQHDDWAIAERRYLSEESMAAINSTPEETITTNTAALPAA